MYKKQADINAGNVRLFVLVLALLVVTILWLNKPSMAVDRVENVVVLEYHRNYTIERYNGKIDTLFLDNTVYNYTDCDYTDSNEEGHNCVITDTMKLWKELNILGYN